MLKMSTVAASLLVAALFVPAGAKPAGAVPAVKPAVKEMTLKHTVGRRGRGFRGFRGFRRGFRGRRFGGRRFGLRRGWRGRRFHRRFYRPRLRYYYGAPAVYGYYGYSRRCRHLKRRAKYTGSRYWWRRYVNCKYGYGYY